MLDYADGHEFRLTLQEVLWDFLTEKNLRVRWMPASAFVRLWRYHSAEAMRLQLLSSQIGDPPEKIMAAIDALNYPVWLAFEEYEKGSLVYLQGRFHAASVARYL